MVRKHPPLVNHTPEDFVRTGFIRTSLLSTLMGFSSLTLCAQSWEAASQARSWAKQDKDDSFTFYDPAAKVVHTWMRDGGTLASVSLAKLEEMPERWLVDPRNNVWVAHGPVITQFDKTGRSLVKVKLPAEVGDVAWDPQGFIISFRTREPYLERRDFKGELVWAFGAKPPKQDGFPLSNRRPILIDDAKNILMADGNSLNLSIIDGATGKKVQETNFRLGEGKAAPLLEGSAVDRLPIALWVGKAVVFAALTANQVPAANRGDLKGLVLARLDLAQGNLEFLPTGLDADFLLIGVLDAEAVFVNPKGGLMLVKVK